MGRDSGSLQNPAHRLIFLGCMDADEKNIVLRLGGKATREGFFDLATAL
jgi:hypothetical protein